MDQNIDVLIVGGGICGRLAQLELEKRGKSTLVIDTPSANHCTAVAAGLANPVVGKFFSVGWRVEDFFVDLAGYYAELENRLKTSFFTPKPLKRIIASAGEQNTWLSKSHLAKYNGFCTFKSEKIEGLSTAYGVLDIAKGGQMNTRVFLKACGEHMPTLLEHFEYDRLDLENRTYKSIGFDEIVYAEGYRVMQNPLWNKKVKIVPNKGEIIEIETDLEPTEAILLGPIFLQHLYGRIYRIGSTYDPFNDDLNVTEEKQAELEHRLRKILDRPYTVTNHYCGVRPTTPDRMPVIGRHPDYPYAYILNGMGSKAVSMAPTLVSELIDYMLMGTALDENVALQRFEKWV